MNADTRRPTGEKNKGRRKEKYEPIGDNI